MNEKENLIIRDLKKFDEELKNQTNDFDYKCNIFPTDDENETVFPRGTISYIGARTGRGKTTALVSVSMDAIRNGKKVFFVTSEEKVNQIIFRMIMNELFFESDFDFRTFLLKIGSNSRNFVKEVLINQKLLKNQLKEKSELFTQKVLEAKVKINDFLISKKLAIFDGLKAKTFSDTLEAISENEEGSIILIDYIQHLRTPFGFNNASRQIQLQEISHELSDICANKNLICIAGAQFGRTDEDKKTNLPDILAEGLFREAGDIEQDAHIAIGIGRHQLNSKEKSRFYNILKSREGNTNGKRIELLDAFSYSYTEAIKTEDGKIKEFGTKKNKTKNQETATKNLMKAFSDITEITQNKN